MAIRTLKRPLSPFSCEPIYTPPDEVLCYGSEEEDSPEVRLQNQRRREAIGRQYLQGTSPFLLSARLCGPFEDKWSNPWARNARGDSANDMTNFKRRKMTIDSVSNGNENGNGAYGTLSQDARIPPTSSPPIEVSTEFSRHHKGQKGPRQLLNGGQEEIATNSDFFHDRNFAEFSGRPNKLQSNPLAYPGLANTSDPFTAHIRPPTPSSASNIPPVRLYGRDPAYDPIDVLHSQKDAKTRDRHAYGPDEPFGFTPINDHASLKQPVSYDYRRTGGITDPWQPKLLNRTDDPRQVLLGDDRTYGSKAEGVQLVTYPSLSHEYWKEPLPAARPPYHNRHSRGILCTSYNSKKDEKTTSTTDTAIHVLSQSTHLPEFEYRYSVHRSSLFPVIPLNQASLDETTAPVHNAASIAREKTIKAALEKFDAADDYQDAQRETQALSSNNSSQCSVERRLAAEEKEALAKVKYHYATERHLASVSPAAQRHFRGLSSSTSSRSKSRSTTGEPADKKRLADSKPAVLDKSWPKVKAPKTKAKDWTWTPIPSDDFASRKSVEPADGQISKKAVKRLSFTASGTVKKEPWKASYDNLLAEAPLQASPRVGEGDEKDCFSSKDTPFTTAKKHTGETSLSLESAGQPEAQVDHGVLGMAGTGPSGPSTDLLETDKLSVDEGDSYADLSTQAALLKAQESFRRNLNDVRPGDRDAIGSGLREDIWKVNEDATTDTPPREPSAIRVVSEEEMMSTQAMVDALSPFAVTTMKKHKYAPVDTSRAPHLDGRSPEGKQEQRFAKSSSIFDRNGRSTEGKFRQDIASSPCDPGSYPLHVATSPTTPLLRKSPIFRPTSMTYSPTSPGYLPTSPTTPLLRKSSVFSPTSPTSPLLRKSPIFSPTSMTHSPTSPGYPLTSPTSPLLQKLHGSRLQNSARSFPLEEARSPLSLKHQRSVGQMSPPRSSLASFSIAPDGTLTEVHQQDGQQQVGLQEPETSNSWDLDAAIEEAGAFLGSWDVESEARKGGDAVGARVESSNHLKRKGVWSGV